MCVLAGLPTKRTVQPFFSHILPPDCLQVRRGEKQVKASGEGEKTAPFQELAVFW